MSVLSVSKLYSWDLCTSGRAPLLPGFPLAGRKLHSLQDFHVQVSPTKWKSSLRLTAWCYRWKHWAQWQEGPQGHMQISSRQSDKNSTTDQSYSALVAVISSTDRRTEHVPALSVFLASTNCLFDTQAVRCRYTLLHWWQARGKACHPSRGQRRKLQAENLVPAKRLGEAPWSPAF